VNNFHRNATIISSCVCRHTTVIHYNNSSWQCQHLNFKCNVHTLHFRHPFLFYFLFLIRQGASLAEADKVSCVTPQTDGSHTNGDCVWSKATSWDTEKQIWKCVQQSQKFLALNRVASVISLEY